MHPSALRSPLLRSLVFAFALLGVTLAMPGFAETTVAPAGAASKNSTIKMPSSSEPATPGTEPKGNPPAAGANQTDKATDAKTVTAPTPQQGDQPSGTQGADAQKPTADSATAQATGQPGAGAEPMPDPGQEPLEPRKIGWSFNGMLGYVDRPAAQRGFQVYKQVCSACHSMNLVAYRSLGDLGFSEAEVLALTKEKQVEDYNDKGERVQRPAKPSDHIVPPYPNEDASRAANNGAYPPDLSLIVKARHHGPDYVYSILTGFRAAPSSETPVANKYYNPYFPNHWISMPPPLSDNVVTYQDGTPATVDQMARDVVSYLQWAAEPEMEHRKQMGIKALIFLFVMAVFFYVSKKRVWRNLK